MKKRVLTNKQGDVRELMRKDIRAMKSAREVLPPELLAALPNRSFKKNKSLKKQPKVAVTLSYNVEVVDYFKQIGRGWRSCINEVLEEWVRKHPHRERIQR